MDILGIFLDTSRLSLESSQLVINLFPIKFECRRQNFSIFSRRCAHHYLFNNKIQEIFKTFICPIITISDNYGSFTDVIIKYFF